MIGKGESKETRRERGRKWWGKERKRERKVKWRERKRKGDGGTGREEGEGMERKGREGEGVDRDKTFVKRSLLHTVHLHVDTTYHMESNVELGTA